LRNVLRFELLAVNVIRVLPIWPDMPPFGVPDSVAVPLWLSVKIRPLGSVPGVMEEIAMLSTKGPAATVNELGTPNVKPTWLTLVNRGLAPKLTVVRVKVCVAVSPEAPVAVIKTVCVPTKVGVNAIVAVPSPLSWKSEAEAPPAPNLAVNLGMGKPVVVTLKKLYGWLRPFPASSPDAKVA